MLILIAFHCLGKGAKASFQKFVFFLKVGGQCLIF